MTPEMVHIALLSAATLLALGFHRYRAAQVGILLLVLGQALGATSLRWEEGACRFLPLLGLLSAALPEGRLLSRRHLVWLFLLLLAVGVTLDAPERLFHSMADAAAGPLPIDGHRNVAMLWWLIAAVVAAGRVWRQGQASDAGAAAALVLAALACGGPTATSWLLSAAGACLLAGLLWGNYRMAFRDPLTGIANRRALDETLHRLSGEFRLAMVDIDHFKQFNDQYGHDAGDLVLREVAQLLARHADGKVFRYGGEEFCVVYPGTDTARAERGLEGARSIIEQRTIDVPAKSLAAKPRPASSKSSRAPRRQSVRVTISAGTAERNAQRKHAQDVLKAADQALYRAKKKGRNRVVKA
ncbi:MAG: GGDEF domain-containing protein [Xanthomonadales bacterium]|nr:GGDEF domain-containing protein [Xanthomonadales bacterium]